MDTMMFHDRHDAGKKLAYALEKYRQYHPLILAIPRGGVEAGFELARYFSLEFSLLISRKLPFPNQVLVQLQRGGRTYLIPSSSFMVSEQNMQKVMDKQRKEISRRIKILRNGQPLPQISGRTIILVDDGIAMGSTMHSAVSLSRLRDA